MGIPFTTGILIGIGETREERIASLYAIRELHERYGHIQEVIVQNFRVKPEIPMHDRPHADYAEEAGTIALARLILGGDMNIQAPPNLTPECYEWYLDAGINDWGGVSPVTRDFINPEAPWPELVELARTDRGRGFHAETAAPHLPGVHLPGGTVHRARADSLRREVVRRGRPRRVAGGYHEPHRSDVRL